MGTLTCAAHAKLACLGGRILGYTSLFTVILLTDAASSSENINLQRQRKWVKSRISFRAGEPSRQGA